ncbi:MAG TPA: hypothetical protein VMK65_03845 [Longimicrobiales bacterium]|nr:hypothetical protein [Longimicrobiales bacterium]
MSEDMHDIRPLDLSALDPAADLAAYEALVARITAAAAPELGRRAGGLAGPVISLAAWLRPALAAAAALALVSAGTLLLVDDPIRTDFAQAPSAAPELGLPSPIGEWLSDDAPPSVMEVMVALEGDVR